MRANVVCPKALQLCGRWLWDGCSGGRRRPVDLACRTWREISRVKEGFTNGIQDRIVGEVDKIGQITLVSAVLIPMRSLFALSSRPTRCKNPPRLRSLFEQEHTRTDRDGR